MRQKIFLILILVLAFCLRTFKLGEVPPHLYWDEASLGYNAYAISQILHDEHGEFLPITRFIAFGDYKPVGYIYAAAASIKFLGLSEFSIRLPSALAGTLLVVVTYFLAVILVSERQRTHPESGFWISQNDAWPLISSLLVAISPWSLQMSRAAFEANFATLLSGTGILFFIKGVKSKFLWSYILASIFLILSMYTFNSHRLFIPLVIAALSLIFIKEIWREKKKYLLFVVCCLLFVAPLVPYFFTRESRLRFEETSWLKDLSPIEESNERITLDGNNLFAKIIHNRRVSYTLQFLKHYTDNFRFDFLFYKGDVNLRLGTGAVGEMYLLELPFFLAGLYFLIRNKSKASAVVFAWLLLAPIPAALARETPHALRTLNILPIPQIITAYGIFKLLNPPAGRHGFKLLNIIVFSLYLVSCILYLRDYYLDYPARSAAYWQFGYKDMVNRVKSVEDKYPCVSITEAAGRPYIYFLLYNQYPPEKYWATRRVSRDWFGFWDVHSFDKYYFGQNPGHCLNVDYTNNKFVIYEKI